QIHGTSHNLYFYIAHSPLLLWFLLQSFSQAHSSSAFQMNVTNPKPTAVAISTNNTLNAATLA
ncbi:hypothetical protein, partial [Cellulomonas carbonis]|uniref:hypothetical protein n=1 Tax=Cellulomonas carbonis TaxID=1386092 RepID=UPI001F23D597